jgi:hypothetical protein
MTGWKLGAWLGSLAVLFAVEGLLVLRIIAIMNR